MLTLVLLITKVTFKKLILNICLFLNLALMPVLRKVVNLTCYDRLNFVAITIPSPSKFSSLEILTLQRWYRIPLANHRMIRFHVHNGANYYFWTPMCNYRGKIRELSTCLLVAELKVGRNVKLGLRFKVRSWFSALQLL